MLTNPLLWILVGMCALVIGLSSIHTSYHAFEGGFFSLNPGGYSELPLDTDLYRVTSFGNNTDDATRYVLYRSAELTKEKGYDCFVTIDSTLKKFDFMFGIMGSFGIASRIIRILHGPENAFHAPVTNADSVLMNMAPLIHRP
jgi:hypothetical protein